MTNFWKLFIWSIVDFILVASHFFQPIYNNYKATIAKLFYINFLLSYLNKFVIISQPYGHILRELLSIKSLKSGN